MGNYFLPIFSPIFHDLCHFIHILSIPIPVGLIWGVVRRDWGCFRVWGWGLYILTVLVKISKNQTLQFDNC